VTVADSAIAAADLAAYEALAAIGWPVAGVHVYQHAPKNAPYPVVVVGDIDGAQPIGRAGDPDMTMNVSVLALTMGEERWPCAAILGTCVAALDGQTIAVPGWAVSFALVAGSAVLAEDGLGYTGAAMFAATALSA